MPERIFASIVLRCDDHMRLIQSTPEDLRSFASELTKFIPDPELYSYLNDPIVFSGDLTSDATFVTIESIEYCIFKGRFELSNAITKSLSKGEDLEVEAKVVSPAPTCQGPDRNDRQRLINNRCLGVKAIDDQLAAVPHIDEGVWYRDKFYGGLSVFIDACIESGDDFWASVESSKPILFELATPLRLAASCWRHMTGQAEDHDIITAEELFDKAAEDYQDLADFDLEIQPKGLDVLAEAIKTYCFVNAAKWEQQFEDIAGAPSRSPYVAISRDFAVLLGLNSTDSFKVLAKAVAEVNALYKEDQRLFEESGEVVGLTEEWWRSKGWKCGEV